MKPFYIEERLHYFDGKLYKIECDNFETPKITLVWQRDEKVYQKERKRIEKQLDELMA